MTYKTQIINKIWLILYGPYDMGRNITVIFNPILSPSAVGQKPCFPVTFMVFKNDSIHGNDPRYGPNDTE